jgi:phospholipid/cholesterol/gamma-HCH transport system permease protein
MAEKRYSYYAWLFYRGRKRYSYYARLFCKTIAIMKKAHFVPDKEKNLFQCSGNWSVLELDALRTEMDTIELPSHQKLTINGEKLSHFDSAGALTLIRIMAKLHARKNQVTLANFTKQQQDLLAIINSKHDALHYTPPAPTKHGFIYQLGVETVYKLNQVSGLIVLIGDLSSKLFRAARQWRRFQIPGIISNINSTGIRALPIVGLLSFLIGVVLAYQMGLQLETYGANMFIAYLSGMAIFREFAPLITAIIVAGRTSSAYTAQIGSMKINEEIDALYTMGLSPTELLVVPKLIGLSLAFPLLVFWSDLFGILGAMIMSKHMLGIGFQEFLTRIQDTVGLKQLMLGMYKAPAFSILIALVGCFQGFRVGYSADSVGTQTTKSVVQALFLIIITDAIYSIIYSWKGL